MTIASNISEGKDSKTKFKVLGLVQYAKLPKESEDQKT